MKKLSALLLALVMVLSLAACGGGGDDKTPSNEDKTPSSSQQQQQNTPAPGTDKPDNTPAANEGGSMADWDYSDYADYTGGVPEPEFDYTVSGIINDQFAFKSKASVDEINAWKQTLLDNGAKEVREGETWAVIDGAHLIEMNGVLGGEARIYISLDDRPVSGGEQPEQSDTADPGTTEPDNSGEVIEGEPWPENEFTSLVPKPENATVVNHMSVAGNDYTVIMAMTLDDAYAYAQQLVAAGFEGDAEMLKSNSRMYYGTNADGAKVEIMWNNETEVMLNIYAAPA